MVHELASSEDHPVTPDPSNAKPSGSGSSSWEAHTGELTSATLTIPEAAALLGVGRNLAYEAAARDGMLAGVPVIRVGRRLVVPHARLLAVLGLGETNAIGEGQQ